MKYDALDPQTGTPTDWSRRVQYQWDPAIEEGDALTGAIAAYVHGAQIDEILARVDASGVVYYHADALGSTEFLTDAAGAVVERYRYDAFGQPTILDGSGTPLPLPALGSPLSALGNRFMFTGREWLSSLALYDYRHRVYSPHLGRWLQPDPIRFAAGDVNLYRYCDSSPVDQRDPTGLFGMGFGWMAAGGRVGVLPGSFSPGSRSTAPRCEDHIDRTVDAARNAVVGTAAQEGVMWGLDRAAAWTGRAIGKEGLPTAVGPVLSLYGGAEVVSEFGPLLKRQEAIRALGENEQVSSLHTNFTEKHERWLRGER